MTHDPKCKHETLKSDQHKVSGQCNSVNQFRFTCQSFITTQVKMISHKYAIAVALILLAVTAAKCGATSDSEVPVARPWLKKAFFYQPRHVHISYGNSATEMVVTWSTIDNPTTPATVEYGIEKFDEIRVQNGSTTHFVDDVLKRAGQYIHRITLTNLRSGQSYYYHCGSDDGWSAIFVFKAMKGGTDWSPVLAVYGDLGNENAQSLTRLQRETDHGMYDAILHVGDFAYDMNTNNGQVGDSFMEQIQPIAAYVPYMTCPGNHEEHRNFTQYKSRFTMPGDYDSMMYSWNMGPIHFVSFSTEFFYYLKYGIKQLVNQYEWLKNDLEEANQPENRALRPWIITYGHRPMYCSNNYSDDCANRDTLVRVGIPYLHAFGLEDLFMESGVDLSIWAHQHSYERMWPLYNYTVLNGTDDPSNPYHNPRGIVHVTTGSAGCKEKHAGVTPDQPYFVAVRNADYGYSRLKVVNQTHLYFEQVSDDQNGKIVDSFYVVKDHHKGYPMP